MSIEVATGSSTRAFSLWNGSGNDAPPPAWFELDFDDSLWATAPTAIYAAELGGPVAGTQPVWSDAVPRAQTDEVLFRQHFDLPSTVYAATIVLAADDYITEIYLNGTALTVSAGLFMPGSTQMVPTSACNLGGRNVLAVHGQNHNLIADPSDHGKAWISYLLLIDAPDVGGTAGPGTGDAGLGGWGGRLSAAVRLFHDPDTLAWDHDGIVFRVRSRGLTVLQAPFPVTAARPETVLCRDPDSGLPMWASSDAAPPAAPVPAVTTTYSTPDQTVVGTSDAPDVVPEPPDAQRACGAAEGMAGLLCSVYDACVALINSAETRIVSNFTSNLKKELTEQMGSLLTEGEFAQLEIIAGQTIFDLVLAFAQAIISNAIRLPLIAVADHGEPSTDSVYSVVKCTAFQALWLRGGDYLLESASSSGRGTRAYWKTYLDADWSFFAGSTILGVGPTNLPWQLKALELILQTAPDGAWERAASVGALHASSQCTACAGYPAP